EPQLQVIIMTAYGTTDTAIEATKLGAFEFVLKPFEIPLMLDVIKRALDMAHLMTSPVKIDQIPESYAGDAIIGKSNAMQEVYKAIGHAAPTNATVLIRGESGTGKELVARAIYQHSNRGSKPFQVINCVAIPDTLLESELFGYEKGSFTGAAHRRIGKIEQAQNGTVFLDEIGDMPSQIQAKLLRLLQEKIIERLGGRESIPIDVRIISATNRNLEKAIDAGTFREDIYYRLKVITIWLPPLRERKEDIPALTDYLLTKHSQEMGIQNHGITDAARKKLFDYNWPGNIRELSNTLQKALIFNHGTPLSSKEISMGSKDLKAIDGMEGAEGDDQLKQWISTRLKRDDQEDLFQSAVDHFSKLLISEALEKSSGNRSRAAKILGVSRPTLHAKIDKYQLQFKTMIEGADD
ncbi:sigma-54 dependent transcriptional regulator, partial [bacterium]|nr:sigma-54 dependent transcriptional regulator [bacterium]